MLSSLRKQISEDYKNLKLDSERDDFFKLVNELTSKANIPDYKKNMIFSHLRRYHKLCVKDFNLRFEKAFEKVNEFSNNGGAIDYEISEMLDFIDESFIDVYYGKKAYKIYKSLKDPNSKDKFYNGLVAIENNKYITSDIAEKRKEKYIDSYFSNLKLK